MMLIAGCSPRRLGELVFVGDQFELTRNVTYAPGDRHRLDLYRPRAARRPAPVVIFLYGGRWQHGSKDEYRLVGDALTRQGLVAVIPDYRLYPQVTFPAWVEDGAAVVRWVRDSISGYGGDPRRIFLAGHSAGAHTAVLLALDQRYLREAGVPAGTLRGVVSLAGPVATEWTDPDVQALMGPAGDWPRTYPLTYADSSGTPLLLLHGAMDKVVTPENSTRLAARIREHGGRARTVIYRGLDHVGIAVALAVPRLAIAPVVEDILRFVTDGSRCPDQTASPSPARP
jgi:acetyl esterase/lipase